MVLGAGPWLFWDKKPSSTVECRAKCYQNSPRRCMVSHSIKGPKASRRQRPGLKMKTASQDLRGSEPGSPSSKPNTFPLPPPRRVQATLHSEGCATRPSSSWSRISLTELSDLGPWEVDLTAESREIPVSFPRSDNQGQMA